MRWTLDVGQSPTASRSACRNAVTLKTLTIAVAIGALDECLDCAVEALGIGIGNTMNEVVQNLGEMSLTTDCLYTSILRAIPITKRKTNETQYSCDHGRPVEMGANLAARLQTILHAQNAGG